MGISWLADCKFFWVCPVGLAFGQMALCAVLQSRANGQLGMHVLQEACLWSRPHQS